MDNGLTFAKNYGLKPGIELTKEQMAALTTDIVWLVTEKVTLASGETVEVIVPKVYLHNGGAKILTPEGALISGSKVVMDLKENLNNSGTIVANTDLGIKATTIDTSGQLGGNCVILQTSGDMNVSGTVVADKAAVLQSGGDLNITTKTYTTTNGDGSKRTDIDRVAGIAVTGNDGVLVVSAKENLTVSGAQLVNLSEKGATILEAGKNVTLDTVHTDNYSQGIKDKDNYMKEREIHDVGSSVQAKGNISIQAGQDVTAKAAYIGSSNGAVTVQAGGNVSLTVGEDTTHEERGFKFKESGFLSSSTTTIKEDNYQQTAHGTNLSGNTVQVGAGRDVQGTAATVVGTNDVVVAAGRDITMTSADQVTTINNSYAVKESGLMAGGGLSVMIGTRKTSDTDSVTAITQANSTVGSLQGNVTMVAGNDAHVTSTDLLAKKDITVVAQNITLDGNENKMTETQVHKESSSGLTIGITSPTISRVESGISTLKRAASRDDKRLAALEVYDQYREIKKDMDIANKIAKGKAPDSISIRVGIGSNSSESRQTVQDTSVAGGHIVAGGDVNLVATSTDATKGTIKAVGESIQGDTVRLVASQDISLEAAKQETVITDANKASGWGAGVSFNPAGSVVGIDASAHMARDNGTTTKTTYTPTVVVGTSAVNTVAGHDTTITGSAVMGQSVSVTTGNNLTITSLQDTETYKGDSKQAGFSISTDLHSNPDIGASAGFTNTTSTYASVTNQAGIYAGTGGFDVTVGNTTKVKGALIDSAATADKNTLTAGNLVMEDIKNTAEYSQKGMGVSYTHYSKKEEAKAKSNDKGFIPMPTVGASGKASSTTKSAIAPGTITIKTPIDISKINRDTKNSLNELAKIFDKKKMEERQELARLVAKYGFEQLHKWEPKNDKERAEKAIAHGVVAELVSRLGGNGAGSGFAAGAINEALISKFGTTAKDHPEAAQWASFALGAMVNGALGKPVQAGGAVAQYGTKWNDTVINTEYEVASKPEPKPSDSTNLEYKNQQDTAQIAAKIVLGKDLVINGNPQAENDTNTTDTNTIARPLTRGEQLAAVHPEKVYTNFEGDNYIDDENGIPQYVGRGQSWYTYEQRGEYDATYKGYLRKNIQVDGRWINVTMYPDNSYVYNRDSNSLEIADEVAKQKLVEFKENSIDFAAGTVVGFDNSVGFGSGQFMARHWRGIDIGQRSGYWYDVGLLTGDGLAAAKGVEMMVEGVKADARLIASAPATSGISLIAVPVVTGEVVAGGVISYNSYENFKKDWDRFQANKKSRSTERVENISKQDSKVWNDLDNVKGQDRKMSGEGRKRRYYEWDHLHNEIEVYNFKGEHIGAMDPISGDIYKPPVKGRKIRI